jgi:ADP-heptose:LPS heptosyltransferase
VKHYRHFTISPTPDHFRDSPPYNKKFSARTANEEIMQVNSMRVLDRWAGVPIAVVLTGYRKLKDLILRRPIESPKRIVIIKLVEQGATVIAAPAIERAIEMVGRENVFFAVFAENRPILDLLGLIPAENVVEIRGSGLFGIGMDTLRAIVRLRRERVDTAVDFEFFSRFSGALTYMSGATRRVGFHSYAGEAGYRGDLMTHRVAYNIRLHASETYRMLIDAIEVDGSQLPTLGFKPPETMPEPKFVADAADVASVRATLDERFAGVTRSRLLLINANAGDLLPIRRWANERYVELAKRLLEYDEGLCIALTGAKSEQADAEALAAEVESNRCVSVAGRTTLTELFALYDVSDVMVTNDSGPAHYATLTTIDVVTLFGPESPAVFGARTDRSHLMWAGLACSPCVNAFNQRVTACQNNLCMQGISVDEVFQRITEVFEQRAQRAPAVADSAA